MQPSIQAKNGRFFPTSAVALQAIIINQDEKFLLLNSPTRQQGWQCVSGGLDANETVLDGILREIGEEAGEQVQVRPLGVVHSQTFSYDENVPHMIGIYYLLEYVDGDIVPGDDMVGSEVRWWTVEDIAEIENPHPSVIPWMLQRARQLHRLWKDEEKRPLQPTI